jgi:hypothetical protein
MKQLIPLFLFLLPCLALAQYPSNGNQKITLGEQTTADGLIFRGRVTDTTLTVKSDTAAYFVLDTVNLNLYTYKASASGKKWIQLGSDTTSLNLVSRFAAKLNISDTATMLTPYWRSGRFSGVLPLLNGGTGSATQNFVDLTNTQTVGGLKTFSSTVTGSSFQPTSSTIPATGMYLPAANTLGFSTASTKVMEIDPEGDIGMPNVIGTSKFTIAGNFGFAGTSENRYLYFPQTLNHTGRFFFQAGAGSDAAGGSLVLYGESYSGNGGSATIGISSGYFSVNNLGLGLGSDIFKVLRSGNVGIGQTTPTAVLHLKAGTATASTAPLKFTSGTNLTTAESGAMEFNGTNLFFSPSTTRHTVNHGLTGSTTLNFPSTLTNLSADLTITVTGAADGDVVSLGVPNAAVNANTSYSAWVSAANTVTVRFNNYSSGTVDPASALFKVFVTK